MKSNLERFNEKHTKSIDGCWLWKTESSIKYGSFWFNRQRYRAHRASYEMFKGTIPESLNVLHTCDNPKCVNPEHLFLGTQQDNMSDKCAKGKQPEGSAHHNWTGGKRASRKEYQRQYYHNRKLKEL